MKARHLLAIALLFALASVAGAAWDKDLPSGSKAASLLDDDVRANNDWLENMLSTEHVFPGTTTTRGRHTVPSGTTATMSAITSPSAGNLFLNDNGYLYKYVAASTNDWVPVVGVDEPRMYSGNVGSLPYGFQLCDGTNSTPDLESQFIVGYDAADADYNERCIETPRFKKLYKDVRSLIFLQFSGEQNIIRSYLAFRFFPRDIANMLNI